MTHEDYARHVTGFLDEMGAVTRAKNADYSAGTGDAMANYYELSAAAGITPVQAWMCLFMKHVTAVMRYAKTGSVSSEVIHSRFVDLANYAMLGDALVKDLWAKGLAHGSTHGKTHPDHPGGSEEDAGSGQAGSVFCPLAVR